MKLSEVKQHLAGLEAVHFVLPGGSLVPQHFHVTEVGQVTKHFIDCGGTVRTEQTVSFQLWTANDTDHRLQAAKLLKIIALSEQQLGLADAEVEVEYQTDTIGIYGLTFDGARFVLTPKQTACLASDQCGIPPQKQRRPLASLTPVAACCTPNSGCC